MTDCIIVGGGLIGMLSARELKKSGQDVLLLDKGELGKEASWAGGGILSPLHPWRYSDEVNRLANIGHKIYPQIAEELHQESGVDPEYIRSGLLVLASDEKEQAQQWAQKWSRKLEVVQSADELQHIEPGLASRYGQALWMPDVGQLRNPRLVKAAKGSLDVLGVRYMENSAVDGLVVANGKVKGVSVNGQEHYAKRVLIAGGAWTAGLLESYGEVPEIEPVKGQMILFKGRPGMLKSILLDEARYLIPRKDGRILCGSTIENVGFDKSVNQQSRKELYESSIRIFPQLESLEIEHHWAGLRPGSPNGDPYIGQHQVIENLFINAGHFRNGVILGIASAQKITEIMLDKTA